MCLHVCFFWVLCSKGASSQWHFARQCTFSFCWYFWRTVRISDFIGGNVMKWPSFKWIQVCLGCLWIYWYCLNLLMAILLSGFISWSSWIARLVHQNDRDAVLSNIICCYRTSSFLSLRPWLATPMASWLIDCHRYAFPPVTLAHCFACVYSIARL